MNNKEKVQSFLKLLQEQKVSVAFENFIAVDFKHHNQHTPAGRKALLDGMTGAHNQFPKMDISVKQIFEDGQFVIAHSLVKLEPNHTGFACVHVCRFHDGKISEMWDLATPVMEESLNTDGVF